MKKILYCVCTAALAVSVVSPCLAADSPWNGTWKLNEAKSHMTGATVTITEAGGMYTLSNGPVSFKFACDGKDYTVLANRSMTCTGSGKMFTMVSKIDGKVTSTSKYEISASGKTLTMATNGTRPDGSAYSDSETDLREGAGTGLAGTWKETKIKTDVTTMVTLTVHDGMLRYEDGAYKDVSDTKLDGTPGTITGGNAPPGLMITTKALSPTKVESVVSLNGKELSRDIMTLAADGKSYTDVTWAPGKESEKRSYVYEKQ